MRYIFFTILSMSLLGCPVLEDPEPCNETACEARLCTIADTAGLPLAPRVLRAAAFLGMVRFLEGWHMLFVTRSEVVGMIGGHGIHRIEETTMIGVAKPAAGASTSGAAGARKSGAGNIY